MRADWVYIKRRNVEPANVWLFADRLLFQNLYTSELLPLGKSMRDSLVFSVFENHFKTEKAPMFTFRSEYLSDKIRNRDSKKGSIKELLDF